MSTSHQNLRHEHEAFPQPSLLSHARESAEDRVREKPISAGLVAFGVGAAAGLMLAVSMQREARRETWMEHLRDRVGGFDPKSLYRH